MKNKRILLLAVTIIISILPAYSIVEWNFKRIDMQDGLADNLVYSIMKDRDGFVWFGTGNGLSRYDGKQMVNFTSERHDGISHIYDASQGMLLFIADNYLNCFDRYHEQFLPVVTSGFKKYRTKGICMLNDSLYWSISGNELHLLKRIDVQDKPNKTTTLCFAVKKKYQLTVVGEESDNLCLSPDKNTLYLITNQCRLLSFDYRTEVIESLYTFQNKERYPVASTSLICDNQYLWVSFLGKGVIRYHLATNTYERYTNPPYKKTQLSHNDVYAFIPINNHNYLAATWDGLTIFTPGRKPEEAYGTIINDRFTTSQPLVSRMISAYYDPQGILYIGTHGGGVIITNIREEFYNKYYLGQNNEICGIATDEENHIWMATFSGEILRSRVPYDPQGEVEFLSMKKSIVRGESAVLCVIRDKDGNLWFGNSNSSISCYDIKKQKFTDYSIPAKFSNRDDSQASIYVWTLFIDKYERFWIGTNQGLLLFDRKTSTFSAPEVGMPKQKINFSVRSIAPGRDNEVWLGTPAGLYKLQGNADNEYHLQGDYEKHKGIDVRYVRSLFSSADGHLYIGYTHGLGVLAGDTIREFYSTKDGLCSNFISCIIEDAQGYIWLGTSSGISRYNKYQHMFFNYYVSGNNRSVALVDKTLFWGNNNTLTYFTLDNIVSQTESFFPLLIDFEVHNKRIGIGEEIGGQIILEKGLPYTRAITLNHVNRDFSLRFKNLVCPYVVQKYNYRLLPYQKEWLICDENGKVSYTNLPAGEYTFEVKSVYPEGTESTDNTLRITILPHWSQTWWLKLCVILFVGTTIFLFVRRYRKKQIRIQRVLKLEHELEISNIERNNEKRLREERENFFLNAAHELRTPLTLVLSPLRGLLSKRKISNTDYQTLAMMLDNGNALQHLIDDLLCVQKIEAGMIKLKLSEVNIVALVREVTASFNQLAESRDIDFSMASEEESIFLWIDVEKMMSAVRNLLSNAFKYTPKGGTVRLTLSETEIDGIRFCQVSITDTGVGIPEELQDKIFDSFVTGDAEPTFSTKIGVGLYIVKNTMDMHHGTMSLQSKLHKGSTFTLSIPKGRGHFTDSDYEIIAGQTMQAEQEHVLPASAGKDNEPNLYSYKRHKILIIEDNHDIRKYIASIFHRKYYTVIEAANGQEGVEQAVKNIPDLIISDIMMPLMDGFECCANIREDQETAHIPIIMLTAKAEDTDRIKSAQMAVDAYMMKPFNPELLKAKVEHLLLYREQLKRLYTKALLLKDTSLSEVGEQEKEQKEDTFMQQIINIIEANLTNDAFGVKMLSEELNLSQPTLYRKIKQRSDLSVIEVIRSVRMSKAASLLMEHKYSILEISLMVGFTDPNTFRKHFTEQFGVPPSKYL